MFSTIALDDVALLQDLGRMLDPLAPRHVGDVDEPVDLLFHLDERAELGEVAHLALNLRADGILVGQVVPRVGLDLLEAERNAPRGGDRRRAPSRPRCRPR